MLVDDKQAREKTATDDLRWLIVYSNDSKLSNQRLEEIASLIESLSAQVAELKKDAERYRRRRYEDWRKLHALPIGEGIVQEAHALSYDAHSDWIRDAAKESGDG